MRGGVALGGVVLVLTAVMVGACDGRPQVQPEPANAASHRKGVPGAAPSGGVHTIVDPLAPNGPIPAYDVTPPPGWKVEASVHWNNANGRCSLSVASPRFRMTSPDGRASIEQFPGLLVTTEEQLIRDRGSSAGDFCVIGAAQTGRALAEHFAIPRLRPQARITGIRDLPLDPQVASMPQDLEGTLLPDSGIHYDRAVYTVEAALENPDGTLEKVTLGGVISTVQQLKPGAARSVLNQNSVAYSVRAPAARLAETEMLAARVRASIRARREWLDAYKQHMAKFDAPELCDWQCELHKSFIPEDPILERENCADGSDVPVYIGCEDQ